MNLGVMSLAVFRKTLRDELVLLLSASVTALSFQAIFVAAMAEMAPEAMQFWRRFGFLRQMMESMFHIDLEGQVSVDVLSAVGLAHPLVLTLALGGVIASCTRVISGEMEQGTADLLLSLPIPRWKVYISVTAAWICTAFCICLASWLGVAVGANLAELESPLTMSSFALALVNLWMLLLAAGGFVMCISAFSSRRALAVGFSIGVLMVSYLIGFLEPFFALVRRISWTSIMSYYRPTDIVREGSLDGGVCLSLLMIGLVFWVAGLIQYSRRDINCG